MCVVHFYLVSIFLVYLKKDQLLTFTSHVISKQLVQLFCEGLGGLLKNSREQTRSWNKAGSSEVKL